MKVLEPENVDPNSLVPHPRNYRQHPPDQIEEIAYSIQKNGFYRNIVVARGDVILAGHGVVEAARFLQMEEVPVVRIDADPESAAALRVLSGDNYLSHMATNDDRALADLLKSIDDDEDDEDGMRGTGFTNEALRALTMVTRAPENVNLPDESKEWQDAGMPEFDKDLPRYRLVVQFRSEESRDEFMSMHEFKISRKDGETWSVWWPPQSKKDESALMFEEEGDSDDEELFSY